MNLIIDIGNTHTRIAIFRANELLDYWQWEPGTLSSHIGEMPVEHCAIACVGRFSDALRKEIDEIGVEQLLVSGMTPTSLKMRYQTPETLGADRLAAAVGAWSLQKGRALLVVDSGTCVTFDYVSAEGEYLGGNIAPGASMRLQAMHRDTALLPKCDTAADLQPIGRNTRQAMQAGAQLGLRREIEGYIYAFMEENPDGHIFLTGGGLPQSRLYEHFDQKITIDKFLVIKGLNEILNETYPS
ncbi:MAG: type III pantothenate kinase [Alloprevotella sp.]|nr:type III pantothenate kinase [Alloprevotella sp.]